MGTRVFSKLRHQWIGSLCASLKEKRRCRFFVVWLCLVLFCLSEGFWAIWDHDATQTSLEVWLPRETVMQFFGQLYGWGFAWSLMLLGDSNLWLHFRGVRRRPTGGGKCGFVFFIFRLVALDVHRGFQLVVGHLWSMRVSSLLVVPTPRSSTLKLSRERPFSCLFAPSLHKLVPIPRLVSRGLPVLRLCLWQVQQPLAGSMLLSRPASLWRAA